VKVIVLGVFVAAMIKLQQFNVISNPDKVHHRCRAAIQQITAPVVTNQFVLALHYDKFVGHYLSHPFDVVHLRYIHDELLTR